MADPIKITKGPDETEIGILTNPLRNQQVGTADVNIVNSSDLQVAAGDGDIVTLGAIADAAVSTDTTGTISGKLRGLVKILADVWNSTSHTLAVTFSNTSLAVTGPLTDTQLRASAVPVSGTFWQTTQPVSLSASSPYSYIAAASANQDSQVVKNSAGVLHSFSIENAVAAVKWVKFYDKATAPTSGDTPVLRYLIPHNNSQGAGLVKTLPKGYNFANGIAFRITALSADNDATAVTAGDVVINLGYA